MTYSYEPFLEYQSKKKISDEIERLKAKANVNLSILVYNHFGCLGPIKKNQVNAYLKLHGYHSKEEWEEHYLRSLRPNKGNNMNEITDNTQANEYAIAADMVEILDEQGNPTGQYRPREATSTATTIYTTAEDGEHEVNVTVH